MATTQSRKPAGHLPPESAWRRLHTTSKRHQLTHLLRLSISRGGARRHGFYKHGSGLLKEWRPKSQEGHVSAETCSMSRSEGDRRPPGGRSRGVQTSVGHVFSILRTCFSKETLTGDDCVNRQMENHPGQVWRRPQGSPSCLQKISGPQSRKNEGMRGRLNDLCVEDAQEAEK